MDSKYSEPSTLEIETSSTGVLPKNSVEQWNLEILDYEISPTQLNLDNKDLTPEELTNWVSIVVHYYIREMFPVDGLKELMETMVEIKQFHEERQAYRENASPNGLPQYKRIIIEGTTTRPSFTIYNED